MRAFANILILSMFFCLPALASQQAVLEAVGGAESVLVKRDGKELQLKQGEALHSGDELITGRGIAVDVRLKDRSLIRVGANSSYTLSLEPSGFLHKLLSGIVRVMVPPDPGAKKGEVRFRMNTPEGTIGVRGTEFVVIRDKDETTLKGLEGEVMFGPAGADFSQESAFVMVVKGFQSSVRKGGSPTSPSKFDDVGYRKDINGKRAAFASLSERKQGALKARSKPVVIAAAEKKSMPSPRKAMPKKGKSEKSVGSGSPSETDPDVMLLEFSRKGDLDQIKELVEKKKANVNTVDDEGFTPLHLAAAANYYEVAAYLIEKNANLNAQTIEGHTPLMAVVSDVAGEEGLKIANLLIDKEANLSLRDLKGRTALDIAKQLHRSAEDESEKNRYFNLLLLLDVQEGKAKK